ncbi:MAG: hypothetical protein HYY46_10105 [Deltaproteobacteria bacterium]|nr:hypothetical protein [Deltaproteobacteria bacterium]
MRVAKLVILLLLLSFAVPGHSFSPPGEFEGNIIQDSQFCLSCHDGLRTTRIGTDHPIGIDYRMAQLKRAAMLKHVSQLDAAVKLENGKVGCTSCHDANSTLPAKLVMSNAQSRLCRSCHDL